MCKDKEVRQSSERRPEDQLKPSLNDDSILQTSRFDSLGIVVKHLSRESRLNDKVASLGSSAIVSDLSARGFGDLEPHDSRSDKGTNISNGMSEIHLGIQPG